MVRKYEPVGGKYGAKSNKATSNGHSKSNGKDRDKDRDRDRDRDRDNRDRDGDKSRDRRRSHSKSPRPTRRVSYSENTKKDKDKDKDKSDAGVIKSRREITLVTMNLNGAGVMGLTPTFKIKMIQEFLQNFPDVIFFQDTIEQSDLTAALEKVSDGKYEYFFQVSYKENLATSDVKVKIRKRNR